MDHQQAEENISIGLAKILRMQHYSGGWVSWEGDSNANTKITPYVLRSLMTFKNLGKMIPDIVFTNGTNYLLSNLTIYQSDPDMLAEVSWTLALLGKKQEATAAWKSLDPKILTRHGFLAYAYTAHILDLSPPNLALQLDRVLLGSGSTDESTYWYWDRYADMGIYAQLLMDRTEDQKAFALIDRLVHAIDLTSDTLSTQAKVQIFRAILQQVQKTDTSLSSAIMIALR